MTGARGREAALRSRSLCNAAAAGAVSEPSHGPRGRRAGVAGIPRCSLTGPSQGAPIRRVERAIDRLEAGRGRIPMKPPGGLRDPSVKSALLDLAGFDAGSGLPYSRAPLRDPVLPSPRASGGPVVSASGTAPRHAPPSPQPVRRHRNSSVVAPAPGGTRGSGADSSAAPLPPTAFRSRDFPA